MNKPLLWIGVVCLATAAAAAGTASAHHSFSMFDSEKYVTVTGVVKTFSWRNPHAMLEMVANKPVGVEEWVVELSAPNIIGRRGWSRDTLKAGDRVPVTFHPMKDGSRYGLLVSVTSPDGKVYKDKP